MAVKIEKTTIIGDVLAQLNHFLEVYEADQAEKEQK